MLAFRRRRALPRWFNVAFAGLLFAVVIVKGVHLSSTLMPFEGWDEYQHLAVADFVDHERRMPKPTEPVRQEFWSFLRAHPHPEHSAMQNAGLGVRTYDNKVWSGETWTDPDESRIHDWAPGLYQAQQGPVYYHVLVALKHLLGITDPLTWADTARMTNVVFAALMLVAWFATFSIVFGQGPYAVLPAVVCMAVAANSLFVYNAARVANDSLANLLASVTVLVYVRALASPEIARSWRPIPLMVAIGALTGLTTITKSFGLALLPVFLLSIPFVIRARGRRFWVGCAFGGVLLLSYLSVAGPYHQRCFREFGTLTGMQESVHNKSQGRDLGDVLEEIPSITYRTVRVVFLRDQFAVSGWSFLDTAGSLRKWHGQLVLLGFLFWALALVFRRSRDRLLGAIRRRPEVFLLLPALWAALLYHAFQSRLAFGVVTTNSWYAILVMPVLVMILIMGAWALWVRAATVMGLLFTIVWSLAHYRSVYGSMIPHQTNTLDLAEGLERIAVHHSVLQFTGRGALALELGLMGIMASVVVLAAFLDRPADRCEGGVFSGRIPR